MTGVVINGRLRATARRGDDGKRCCLYTNANNHRARVVGNKFTCSCPTAVLGETYSRITNNNFAYVYIYIRGIRGTSDQTLGVFYPDSVLRVWTVCFSTPPSFMDTFRLRWNFTKTSFEMNGSS